MARRLRDLREAAKTDATLRPFILDAARSYGTLYEIMATMKDVFEASLESVFF